MTKGVLITIDQPAHEDSLKDGILIFSSTKRKEICYQSSIQLRWDKHCTISPCMDESAQVNSFFSQKGSGKRIQSKMEHTRQGVS